MDQRANRRNRVASGNPWSAGCTETGLSGAEGGPRKRAGRNAGTAPRSDPYTKLPGPAKWTYYYLYVIIDIYSRYVVGWLLADAESKTLAERLLADTIGKQHINRAQLTIHADNGSSMASKPVAFLLADLGVTKSHSRPHTSNDNPYSEAQFRTLKYRPDFPDTFGSAEDARGFCQRFFTWYNTEHYHSGVAWLHPVDVHYGRAETVRAVRAEVLDAAYARNPDRFVNKPPQPAALPTAVWINKPETEENQAVGSMKP
jgi:putative transposase